MTTWTPVCVLCAQRSASRLRRELGREPTADEVRARLRPLESGHCCPACANRIADDLTAIVDLAAMAAAWIVPGSTSSSGARTVPSSRPPLNVEALDPALASVPGHDAPLLVLLEEWERMTRQMRSLAPYGPASAARSAAGARTGHSVTDHTHATLTAVCGFLRAQVAWMATTPDFPLEDFAAEVRECAAALRRWDLAAEERGQVVLCPTLGEDGECGKRLHYRAMDEHVTCPRCRVTRDAATLVAIAMADGREVWLDPEAAAKHLGVSESTLLRMARKGAIERSHGRYRVSDVEVSA